MEQTAFYPVDISITPVRLLCRTHPRGTGDCPSSFSKDNRANTWPWLGLDTHTCEHTQMTAALITAYGHELSLCYFSIRSGTDWVQRGDIKAIMQGCCFFSSTKSVYQVWRFCVNLTNSHLNTFPCTEKRSENLSNSCWLILSIDIYPKYVFV